MAWQPVSYGSGLPGSNIGRQIEGFGEALFQRQQRRQKEERQKQYQMDLEAAGASNDPNAYINLIAKYPEQASATKAYQQAAAGAQGAQRQTEFQAALEAASQSDDPNAYATLALQYPEQSKSIQGVSEVFASGQEATQRQRYATDLEAAFEVGTPEAFTALLRKYPGQRELTEQFKSQVSDEVRGAEFNRAAQAYSLLEMGNPEAALAVIDESIEAFTNAGQPVPRNYTVMRDTIAAGEIKTAKSGLAFAMTLIDPERSEGMGKAAKERLASLPDLKESEYFPDENLRVDTDVKGNIRVYQEGRLITDPKEASRLQTKVRAQKQKVEARGNGKRTSYPNGISFVDFDNGDRDVYENGILIPDPVKAAKAVGEAVEAKAAEPLGKKELAAQEDVLRKEWLNVTKDNRAIRNNYDKVRAAAVQDTAASDLSLVFAFMKILDPTSVVRESEQASATNAAGVPDRIRSLFNRVQKGTRLTPAQRADFLARAGDLVRGYQTSQDEIMAEYQTVSDNRGLNADNIFVGYQPITEEQLQADYTQAASIATETDMTAPSAAVSLTPEQLGALREAGIVTSRLPGGR